MIIYSKSTPEEIAAYNKRQREYEESIRSPDFGKKPLKQEDRIRGNGNRWSTVNELGRHTTYSWWWSR